MGHTALILFEDLLMFVIITLTFKGEAESRAYRKHREGEQGVEICGRLSKFCFCPGGLRDHHWFWQVCSNRD